MSKVPYSGCQRDSYYSRTQEKGGYRFKDSGDGQRGVWTDAEKAAEASRRNIAQQQAAAQAEAETHAKIDAIQADETLTQRQKIQALAKLTASGHSTEEFGLINLAREQASEEL
jgi:hypothetical protein